MILVELALQGIRGFPPLHRIALKTGLNVAQWHSAEQRRALFDLLYHSLFPDPSRGQSTTALADPSASQSRVALTFYGRDKLGYRLIRDTVTGATKLYRYDDKRSKYRLFSEVSTEVAQFVRVQQQLPDEVAFERLFTFDAMQAPSLGPKARTRSGAPLASLSESGAHPVAAIGHRHVSSSLSGVYPPGALGGVHGTASLPTPAGRQMSGVMSRPDMSRPDSQFGGFGSSMNLNNALVQSELESPEAQTSEVSADEKHAQLERMRSELTTILRGEQAQSELDRIQAERTELTQVAAEIRHLRAEIERIQSELNPAFKDLSDGIGERIRTFETRERRFQQEQHKLMDEQAWLLEEADSKPRLVDDRYFVVGLLGALGCIALASLTERPGLALANLPFATVAAGAAFRWVHELEDRYRQRVKASTIQKQLDRLERNHDLDTAATRKLMKVLGTDDASDLIGEIEAHESRRAELAAVTKRYEALRHDPRAARADRELARLDAAAAKLETEVLGASGSSMSADQMRRRIRALEQELGASRPPTPAVSASRRPDPLMGGSEFISQDLDHMTPDVPEPPQWVEASGLFMETDGVIHEVTGIHRLPPMPAPGEALAPTPDIKRVPRVRETSVPGVVAHRSATMDLPELQRAPSRPPSRPLSSAPDDDDEGLGYAGGYGGGSGTDSSGGASAAPVASDGWFLVGMGGGFGAGGFGGGYGGYGGGHGGDLPVDIDRSRDLVAGAVDLLQVQVDSLEQSLGPRLGEYLAAFTDKQFRRATFGPRGEVSVAPKAGDFIRYAELQGETLDLVDAAIKMALVEMVVRDFRIPVFFDDPFTAFPPQRRKLFGQMIAYLGRATQVIVATEATDLKGHMLSMS